MTNLDLSDDGSLDAASGVEGHSISDDGTEVVSEPSDVDFGANLSVTDDGDDTVTIDGQTITDEGTITASGGSSPAADVVVSTSLAQTDPYEIRLYVDADPLFNADYQFNYDYGHFWDDSTSTLKIDFTVNWDIDPGGGNDVTLHWEVLN